MKCFCFFPTVKPKEVIISLPDVSTKLQLFRSNADGSNSHQILTDDTNNYFAPFWSPDATKVVCVQDANGYSLIIMNPDGSNASILVNGFTGANTGANAQINQRPTWTPDSKNVVYFSLRSYEPVTNAIAYIVNINTLVSQPLFTDATQITYANLMPAVSLQNEVAFISNRSGPQRLWKSAIDGSGGVLISPGPATDPTTGFPIEQKVPNWSLDGNWIAHWEGVETNYMGSNTVLNDQIANTWNVWVVDRTGNNKRVVGHGDEPTWSPDSKVTRVYGNSSLGYIQISIEGTSTPLGCMPTGLTTGGSFTWNPFS